MTYKKTLQTSLLASCAALALGCASGAPGSPDEPVSASAEAITSTNRLSMNRLSMNRLSMNGLSAARLTPDGLNLSATDLLLDDAGRDLLRYIVRCALPEGATLTGTAGSSTYTFEGLIGIAPEWLDGPLSQKGQRWMSACLLAHVNGYGVEVPISLRGAHPALSATSGEKVAYSNQETTFYGNVFTVTDKYDELGDIGQRMYACGGAATQTMCGDDPSAASPLRSCAGNPDCVLKYMGPCRDLSDKEASACAGVKDGSFTKCHADVADADGERVKGPVYKEVITVYLQENDWAAFYPSCEATL